jgi:hypothetical protein
MQSALIIIIVLIIAVIVGIIIAMCGFNTRVSPSGSAGYRQGAQSEVPRAGANARCEATPYGAIISGSAAKREIEARFLDVDVKAIIKKLKKFAKREFAPTLMTRAVFALPNGYARVRTEPDHKNKAKLRVVLTSKVYPKREVYDNAKSAEAVAPVETEIALGEGDTYADAVQFMRSVGLRQKAEHEQYREEWRIDKRFAGAGAKSVEGVVEIDWLPGLMPSVEIECPDDESIRAIARALDLDYDGAIFGGYGKAYARVYSMSEDVTNNQITELKFATVAAVLAPFIKGNAEGLARATAQELPSDAHLASR